MSDRPDLLLRFVREHAGLAATLALTVFVVARLIAVARGDLTTALAIIANAGTANVILGTVVGSFHSYLFLLTVVWLVWMFRTASAQERSLRVVIGFVLLFASMSIIPRGEFLAATGLVFAVSILLLVLRRWLLPIEPSAIAFVVLLLVFAQPTVWMSPERITRSGSRPLVGYVLNSEGEWWAVLSDADRQVVLLKATDVEDRVPCSLKPSAEKPLVDMFKWPARPLPACG